MEEMSNRELFEHYFENHYHTVLYFSNRYLFDSQKAEDIAQEVFIALWDNIEGVDRGKEIVPYLFTLTKYRALNLLKREQYHRSYLKSKTDAIAFSIDSLKDSTSTSLYSGEVKELIQKTIDEMPEKTRETFIFSRFKDLKNREIAELQSISIKTVEYRISSAFKYLRRHLKDYLVLIPLLKILIK